MFPDAQDVTFFRRACHGLDRALRDGHCTAHQGDANLDGIVDVSDLATFRNHSGSTGGWAEGDFNGDGMVDIGDYQLLSGNMGSSGGDSQFAAAPEPSTLALLGFGSLGLLVYRRSRIS